MNQPDNIVQEVLNNRERGSARLLSEYRDCLYSMALALCRDKAEAEDLVFCTIERAIDKIDTFKNHDSLYSWLCVILVNLYRDSIIDSGAVTGLYDTVTGDVISNGSSFTFGGAGQDHGQLKAYIKPGYGNNIRSGESTTLAAYAPGATSYRWLCDGKPIDGGTDGVLNVVWTRGGVMQTPGFKVHSYQAIAVFEDFYGVTRESEPSAAADIKCRQIGMLDSIVEKRRVGLL